VTLADGETMQVNCQLRTLKCTELVLMAIAPRLHRMIRKLYDVTGQRLAGKIRHPLLADAAFVTLTPMEWLAGMIMRRIVPDSDTMSLYN
jgi:hypothetical protein